MRVLHFPWRVGEQCHSVRTGREVGCVINSSTYLLELNIHYTKVLPTLTCVFRGLFFINLFAFWPRITFGKRMKEICTQEKIYIFSKCHKGRISVKPGKNNAYYQFSIEFFSSPRMIRSYLLSVFLNF